MRSPAPGAAASAAMRSGSSAEITTVGMDLGGSLGDRSRRSVGPQVGDPPPPAAQGQAEDDQRQVMRLTGRAGEDGVARTAAAPSAGEREQPGADQVRGEVFLGDRPPPRSQRCPTSRSAGSTTMRLADSSDRVANTRSRIASAAASSSRTRASTSLLASSPSRAPCGGAAAAPHAPRRRPGPPIARTRSARSCGEPGPRRPIRRGGTPVRSGRLQHPVAALPGTQRVHADAGAAAQLPDSDAGAPGWLLTRLTLDNLLTGLRLPATTWPCQL